MPHKSKNSVEEKVHLVQRCLKGEIDIEEASRENRINRAAIQAWIGLRFLLPSA